jgi:hypothetical protein
MAYASNPLTNRVMGDKKNTSAALMITFIHQGTKAIMRIAGKDLTIGLDDNINF